MVRTTLLQSCARKPASEHDNEDWNTFLTKMSALIQLHFHSWLNAWLQWIEQRRGTKALPSAAKQSSISMEYIDGTCVYVIMRKNPALDDNLPTKCLNLPNQLNNFLHLFIRCMTMWPCSRLFNSTHSISTEFSVHYVDFQSKCPPPPPFSPKMQSKSPKSNQFYDYISGEVKVKETYKLW